METTKRRRCRWSPYVLAAGFVMLASGAALPRVSANLATVIREIRALFA